jgi:CBS domain-containing protein
MKEKEREPDGQMYFLSEITKGKVVFKGKKVGRLADLVAKETGVVPYVTHIYVKRSFGYPSLLIPWENVKSFSKTKAVVDIESVEAYEKEPSENMILLKDHILDKKVLDIQNRDVEIAFDLRLVTMGGRLYVSDVEFSRHALFRRMHIYPLADLIYGPEEEQENRVSWLHVQQLSNLGSFGGEIKLDVLKEKLLRLKPVDIANVMEQMEHESRVNILNAIETGKAADILEEIEPTVQRELVASLNKKKVVKLIDVMTPGQAADILTVLPVEDREEILASLNKIDREDAAKIRAILGQHEESVRNYATQSFVKISPTEIVDNVQEKYHLLARGKEVTMYLYVVDSHDHALGVVDVDELLRAPGNDKIEDVMNHNVIALTPENTIREAAVLFSKYDLRALPIIDNGKIMGVVPSGDIMKLKHVFWG